MKPPDYRKLARTYDYTRGASPTVVRALAGYLPTEPGSTLLDVAGGTGNYARVFAARGFDVFVLDHSMEMLAHAARKLGPGRCLAGDATRLPVRDGGVDVAILVHALHLVEDPGSAIAELRRVVRAGPALVVDATAENAGSFVQGYFGLEVPASGRPPTERVASWLRSAGFTRIEHAPLVYTDSVDGSLRALHTSALHLAGRAYLRNTSFWAGLDDATRSGGLAALARDLRSGALQERVDAHMREAVLRGHETILGAWP